MSVSVFVCLSVCVVGGLSTHAHDTESTSRDMWQTGNIEQRVCSVSRDMRTACFRFLASFSACGRISATAVADVSLISVCTASVL